MSEKSKSDIFKVKLSKDERRMLETMADVYEISKSEFVRMCIRDEFSEYISGFGSGQVSKN